MGISRKKNSEHSITADFSEAKECGSLNVSEFLKPYAPYCKEATQDVVQQVERLLEEVRKSQKTHVPYDPPEGREEFAKRVSRFLLEQNLCIHVNETLRASSLTVLGDSIMLMISNFGRKSLTKLEKIDIEKKPYCKQRLFFEDDVQSLNTPKFE